MEFSTETEANFVKDNSFWDETSRKQLEHKAHYTYAETIKLIDDKRKELREAIERSNNSIKEKIEMELAGLEEKKRAIENYLNSLPKN